METYLTIKNSDGELCPMKILWWEKMKKLSQPDIDKYMEKAKKEGSKLVRVKIIEIK